MAVPRITTNEEFDRLDGLFSAVAECPAWRASDLRTGCTEELEKLCMSLIKRDLAIFAKEVESDNADIKQAIESTEDMQAVLKFFDPENARSIMQLVTTTLLAWQSKRYKQELQLATSRFLAAPAHDQLPTICSSLQAMSTLSPDLQATLGQVADKLVAKLNA